MASRLTNASLFAVIAVALALPSTAQTFEIERHVSEDSVHASALTRDVSRRFAEADRIQFIEDVRELGATSISVVLDIEWTPEGYLTDEEVAAQRERIAKAQAEVISELSRYGIAEDAFKYAYVPGMEVEFTEHTIPALDNVPVVSRLEVTAPAVPATPISTERIEAPAIWERGFDGTGWVVAVLDTGVTPAHSALSNKIVREACFSQHQPASNKYSLCFGGGTTITQSTQAGSAVDCSGAIGCGHGTRMAGIIAATTQSNVTGVAPGAKLLPIQTNTNINGSVGVVAQNLNQALQHVYSLRNQYQFAAVNMSFGSIQTYSSTCNGVNSNTANHAANLRSVGIVPVAGAGNNNSKTGISWPACISHVVSVGAVTKNTDQVLHVSSSSGSNSASILDLWAPGGDFDILTTSMTGGTQLTGYTSAATAHVSGAIAALRDGYPSASTNTIIEALKLPGIMITDPANGIQKPRVALELSLPPLTFSVQSDSCYGWTNFNWSSVPPWSELGGSIKYSLELAPIGPPIGAHYPIYVGTSTSTFVDVPESGYVRVRACRGSRCGGANYASNAAIRYSYCQ